MKKFLTVVLILLIMAAIAIGAWYLYTNQESANDEIASLKNEINSLKENENQSSRVQNTISNQNQEQNNNSQSTNNANNTSNTNSQSAITVSNVIGAYDNGGGEGNYQCLCIFENGTFAYYPSGEVDSHNEGYYVINNNKITLYSILSCGNDPGATVTNTTYDVTVNNDGTLVFNNMTMSRSTTAQSRYDNNNENGGISLSNSISSRLKNNYLLAE